MEKINISDFSGGILESKNPKDYAAGNKWSEINGFIHRDLNSVEAQMPKQTIGGYAEVWKEDGATGATNTANVSDLWPLNSASGTYLVASKYDGTLWWTKAPGINTAYTTANACLWRKIKFAENFGWDSGDNETQPQIPINGNTNQFICDIPFEAYKYTRKPDTAQTTPSAKTFTDATISNGLFTDSLLTITFTDTGVDLDYNTGDEVFILLSTGTVATAHYGGLRKIADATSTTITIEYGATQTASGSIDNAGTIYSSNLRGNNVEFDTLLDTVSPYAKSTCSGVLISNRRIYGSVEDGNKGKMYYPEGSAVHKTYVAYVDEATTSVKIASFPNFRRWPQYRTQKEFIVNTALTSNVATLTTLDNHTFKKNQKVTIEGLKTPYNGTYKITGVTSNTFTFARKYKNLASTVVTAGTARIKSTINQPIDPFIATNKAGVGEIGNFIKRYPEQGTLTYLKSINEYSFASGVVTLEIATSTGYEVGDSILIKNLNVVMSSYSNGFLNGQFVITGKTSTTVSFKHTLSQYYPAQTNVAAFGVPTIERVVAQESDVNDTKTYPRSINYHHPYTYLNGDLLLLPGKGIIPTGNVGTMWGSHLLIGDIEYRKDAAVTSTSDTKLSPNANNALLGNNLNDSVLKDGNTAAERGAFYYSETAIDEFDPRSVISVGNANTRITGMHVLQNRLIVLTSVGGEQDGVIAYTGLLSQLHPYAPGTPANPLAIRKQIIKGGIGTVDGTDETTYFSPMPRSCVWKDAGLVTFIDSSGSVMYTDGNIVDRLDRFSYQLPRAANSYTGITSSGKHLFVFQNTVSQEFVDAGYAKLLCFTLLNTTNGIQGAWTTINSNPVSVAEEAAGYDRYNILVMRGSTNDIFMVEQIFALDGTPTLKSKIIRYAFQGPIDERGCLDNEKAILWISTPPIGSSDEFKNTIWNTQGVTFSTDTTCLYYGFHIQGASILEQQAVVGGQYNFATHSKQIDKTYQVGLHSTRDYASIGSSPVISVRHLFKGNVRVEGVSVWHSGTTEKRGEANYG